MAAREDLLAALRRTAPPATPLPDLTALGAPAADLAARFADAVAAVGGACVRVPDVAAARAALPPAGARISLVPALAASTANLDALASLELAVLPGEMGVAENGAVWVDAAALPHPALFVIPEHLVLCVEAANLVADLHAAYARLGRRAARYGVFVAGPSKTADIEQALVIGAHGPRSCTVLVIG
jgi:L-lactate dehydrogenase complex protein LldG